MDNFLMLLSRLLRPCGFRVARCNWRSGDWWFVMPKRLVDLLIVMGLLGGVFGVLGWKINVQLVRFFLCFFLMADHQNIYLYMIRCMEGSHISHQTGKGAFLLKKKLRECIQDMWVAGTIVNSQEFFSMKFVFPFFPKLQRFRKVKETKKAGRQVKGHELVAAFGKYFNQDRGQFLGVFCWRVSLLVGGFGADFEAWGWTKKEIFFHVSFFFLLGHGKRSCLDL